MKALLILLSLALANAAFTYTSLDELYLLENTRTSYEDFMGFLHLKFPDSKGKTLLERPLLREALAHYLHDRLVSAQYYKMK